MSDSFVVVDPQNAIAPYQQIVEQLKGLIERGELAPNELLPTVRQLAGDLNVAPNTVARAYTELQESQWLTSEGRRGTRVASKAPTATKRARATSLARLVRAFIADLEARGYSKFELSEALQRNIG